MPTYEYACAKCGHEFEIFQSMKDAALTVCPKEKCKLKKWGKGRVKKMMGVGAGLIFKGSGFYITDYRSENYKQGAQKDAPAAPSTGEAKGGGEAKPAGEKKSAETNSTPAKADSKASSGSGSSPAKSK